ncbi:MAG TPA: L,D-transpeptidase [Burkholderiaceae bacterium]
MGLPGASIWPGARLRPRGPGLLRVRGTVLALLVTAGLCSGVPAGATPPHKPPPAQKATGGKRPPPAAQQRNADADGVAEARLIAIYKLIGQGRNRQALAGAEALVRSHPNFQLAQLVYGDLLSGMTRPVRVLGDAPPALAAAAGPALAELREESALRLKALRERPPAGTVPSQLLALSQRNKHVIAVDASRARLYLFENTPAQGLKLVADYYISVGKSGIEKAAEGDLRTPLGVYFITSQLHRKSLKEFYGSGALPINYPNPYDTIRGKTGSGIWLHGTPPNQFSRAPKATDGCVVLANPDLEHLIRTVEVRSTPVVIAPALQWVSPSALKGPRAAFEQTLAAWQAARTTGNLSKVVPFYTTDFTSNGKTFEQWLPTLEREVAAGAGRPVQTKDLSVLHWKDVAETMVVTFAELPAHARTGPTRRQYWIKVQGQWKIFFEGVIG